MTTASELRMASRLDEMAADINTIKVDLSAMRANTAACQKVVMGNGLPGIGIRVDRLEQTHGRKSRWHWAGVAFVSTLVSGTVLVVLTAVMHALGH